MCTWPYKTRVFVQYHGSNRLERGEYLDIYLASVVITHALGLLQSLEDNFILAVAMFVIGFICTVTTMIFVVVMHRSRERPYPEEEDRR